MDFRLLGPVEVHTDGGMLDLGTPRQRGVLAALAVDARRVVTKESLIERIWGDVPPNRARDALYVYIGRIRRELDPDGTGQLRLVRRSGGYLLDAAVDEVDLHQFQALEDAARDPGCPDRRRAELLARSLSLWRGTPLAGLSGGWVDQVRQAWHRRRIGVATQWAQALLRLGDAGPAIGPLTDLSAEYPLVESIAATLMNAMAALGRGAEALDCYFAIRRRLADELGTDPGDQLRAAYQSILGHASSPAQTTPRPTAISRPPPRAVPAQLPLDVHRFVGRRTELSQLDALAADGSGTVVAVISGSAGVGKTALAVHWSHLVADDFPDGQLYINLRGFDPSANVMTAAQAVRDFLDALGVPPEQVPSGLDAQCGLYRERLAGKRVLLLLDNAHNTSQVRPLLPGAASCLVVVTSRNRLTGLVAAQGAQPLILDPLSEQEAHQMLTHRIGHRRVVAEPDAVEEIIRRCARLPLALAVLAARAATQPQLPLQSLAGELQQAQDGLDAWTDEDPATDVRSVFSWSYQQLSASAARQFRLLALHLGPAISVHAAASLAAVSVEQARKLLAELNSVNLIAEEISGRFACHDLLRVYASELARVDEPPEELRAATHRLLDHYLHTAHAAAQLLQPVQDPITLPAPAADTTAWTLATPLQALNWFSAEREVLLAAVDRAAANGFDEHAWQLAGCLFYFHNRLWHWLDCATAQTTAVAAAQRLANRPAHARARRLLAQAHLRLGNIDDALAELDQALDLHRQEGDLVGQANAHRALCLLWDTQDRYPQAIHHGLQALDLYRAAGHRTGEARTLNAVGWMYSRSGDHQRGLSHCQQALPLLQQLGDRYNEAATWDSLGHAHHHLGRYSQATTCYQRSLDMFQELGDRTLEANTLIHLGDAHAAAGDLPAAANVWQLALNIFTAMDHPDTDAVRARLIKT